MLGNKIRIEFDGFGVSLLPPKEADIPLFAEGFSNMRVHMYTRGLFAQSIENEKEWYDRMRHDQDSVSWTIKPDGSDDIVGVTSLHNISEFSGSCTSGIVIFNTAWWGKGVASRAHPARTLFAADFLARNTIRSQVRKENVASRKALERVGYGVVGCEPRTSYREGKFLDTLSLVWINPERIGILFPEGLPRRYSKPVARAKISLEKAREFVSFE